MPTSDSLPSRLTKFLAFGLFVLFCLRYWLNAQGKTLWMDETDGLHTAVGIPWSMLFVDGAPAGQANKSPLAYMLDKAWMALWGYQPQYYWNLRVFFRLIPAAFWSIAGVSVFVFLSGWLKRHFPLARPWTIAVLAGGVAFFYYDNSFMHIYAIESRSYSLWVTLSTIHFLLLWQRLENGFTRRTAVAFTVVCFILAFSTYASLFQIYAGLAAVLLRDLLEKRRLDGFRAYRHDLLGLGIATVVGLWYFAHMTPIRFPSPPFSLYIESVREVMLKAFHHHGAQPALLTFPLAFLLVPYLLRKRPECIALYAFTLMNVALTAVMFAVSYWKGGIYHSRYAVFLLPTLTWTYLAMIACLVSRVLPLLRAHFPAAARLPSIQTVFVILAVVQVAGSLKSITRDIYTNAVIRDPISIYGRTPNPETCPAVLPHDPEDVERLNDLCRGFAR